jgi:chromate reductase
MMPANKRIGGVLSMSASTSTTIRLLGIAGSLRRASHNRGLLRAASALLPPDVQLDTFDLAPIPLYNFDLEKDFPAAVQAFKNAIAAAGGLLIATPEYNWSITGVLKNALDWASRPPKESVLRGKPAAMMGAGGVSGTTHAQGHLRQVAAFTGIQLLETPQVAVARSWEKFDSDGNLIDDSIRPDIAALLTALADFIRQETT